MMFANFPVLGITQGLYPLLALTMAPKTAASKRYYNLALRSGTAIALLIFFSILFFSGSIVSLFTNDTELIDMATPALRISFLATPLILFQLIGSAYFQAIGKALPAMFLALTKQGFCLIPLLLVLPSLYGLNGIWFAFPIADVISAALCYYFLKRQTKQLNANAKVKAKELLEKMPDTSKVSGIS